MLNKIKILSENDHKNYKYKQIGGFLKLVYKSVLVCNICTRQIRVIGSAGSYLQRSTVNWATTSDVCVRRLVWT